MSKRLIQMILPAAALLAALNAWADTFLEPPLPTTTNRWAMDFRMAFNVTASFQTKFGPSTPIAPPGVSGVDRNYDDGYNRVDDIGGGGYTHYWGYDDASQYDAANHTLTMHSASGTAGSEQGSEALQFGVELTYNRELGRRGKYRWGVETAINYMNVSIHDDQAAPVRGTLLTDTYQLPPSVNGGYVIPPPAPYHGTYEAPPSGSPTIYDTPSNRATSALNATSSGHRDFDADVIGWRLGPYLEFPVATNFSVSLSGGFSLVGVVCDYRFRETVTYNNPGSTLDGLQVPFRGSGSHAGLLAGGYVGGGISVVLEKGWSAFGGAQFQYAGSYTHREGVGSAKLDLGKSIFVSLGATYSF